MAPTLDPESQYRICVFLLTLYSLSRMHHLNFTSQTAVLVSPRTVRIDYMPILSPGLHITAQDHSKENLNNCGINALILDM